MKYKTPTLSKFLTCSAKMSGKPITFTLTGQVCADSVGNRIISGTGGLSLTVRGNTTFKRRKTDHSIDGANV